MKYTSLEIASILNGEIQGSPKETISSIAKIEEGVKGDLCFLSNPKYSSYLYSSKASVIVVDKNLELEKDVKPTLIKVEDPYLAFSRLLNMYNKATKQRSGINKNSHISNDSTIGKNCYIGPFVFIGKNVKIKDNVEIHPHCFIGDNVIIDSNTIIFSGVRIYKDCIVGKESIIHSGTVIGADGFGFAPSEKGMYQKIPQIGNVIIKDHVEIGSNTTIDRATLGSTIINKGVKLDNQIQVGHNVEIGKNTVIAALTAIAGSTKIGKNCMIGGSTAIAGHLNIGNSVKIAGHTGVASNIKDKQTIQGPYAFDQKDFLRSYIIFKKLPKMYKTLEAIKKQLSI